MKLVLDQSKLTVGDIEDFESMTGMTIGQALANTDAIPMKAVRALIVVVGRKSDPSLTETVVRNWPMARLNEMELVVEGAEPDPTDASA